MGDLWIYLAALAGVAAALGFVATRRQQAIVRKWDALLTPAGRQALDRLELQTVSDGSMADYSLDAAQRARRRDDIVESGRLLQLAYSVIEDATPDRLRRLRAISVCIRMASAVVPVKPLRPSDYKLVPIIATMGLGAALHHLLLTSIERFLLRVHLIGVGFKIAVRAMGGATAQAALTPGDAAPWDAFERGLADWKTLDRDHVEAFRALVLSLSREIAEP